MAIGLSGVQLNSGSNLVSDLKLRARLSLNCMTQSPYDYQLIVLITKCESAVQKRLSKSKENISE